MSYAVGVFLSVEYMKNGSVLPFGNGSVFFVFFVPAKANLCIVFCNTIILVFYQIGTNRPKSALFPPYALKKS